MNKLPKSASLDTLELPAGDHWVRFHVEEDTISYEVASSRLETSPESGKAVETPTDFVRKWGGSVRKEENGNDEWLAHINKKHLR